MQLNTQDRAVEAFHSKEPKSHHLTIAVDQTDMKGTARGALFKSWQSSVRSSSPPTKVILSPQLKKKKNFSFKNCEMGQNSGGAVFFLKMIEAAPVELLAASKERDFDPRAL